MHVKTDVFCSASLILPDKGARQINVGGWSVDSLYGIRLYTPDGSPGVNGTNDWEENGDELTLQVSMFSLYRERSINLTSTIASALVPLSASSI